jgi:acetate---CoA ligase (ADP-forming)
VVAHAGWEREPDRPERAEIAFAIADATQHNGLGTILLGQLIEAADQAGVAVLSAEVLPQNQHMLHVFGDSGIPVTTPHAPRRGPGRVTDIASAGGAGPHGSQHP